MRPARSFIALYALAYCGLFVAFMPFVSILLQVKVTAIVPDDRVRILGYAVLGGAVIASGANILWGWASDLTYRRYGTRRPWIALGVVAIVGAFYALHRAMSLTGLFGAIALWQVALNMMFAPMVAVMADEVPDDHKGRVSGLLGISHPIGVLSAAIVTLPLFAGEAARYTVNCVLIVAMIAPFLVFARETGGGDATAAIGDRVRSEPPPRADLVRAWSARLAMQSAGNGLTAYAFFHFADLLRGTSAADAAAPVAQAMAVVTAVAAGATVIAGRLSDRIGGRKPFLAGATMLVALGLIAMALAGRFVPAIIAYGFVITGLSVFLALHSALAMQLLPSAATRGRDLGILNLANTLPACVPPLVAMLVVLTGTSLTPVFVALAVLALIGGLAAVSIRSER